MKLFGSRKAENEKLEEFIKVLEIISSTLTSAYSLSNNEKIELCKLLFRVLARSYGIQDGLAEQQISSIERRVLGKSFSDLVRDGYGTHIVLVWGEKLFTVQGELKKGANIRLGPGENLQDLKVIKVEDIQSLFKEILDAYR